MKSVLSSKSILGLVGTLIALSATHVVAQVNWQLRTPTANPPVRAGHVIAFDSLRGHTVLFGGVDAGSTNFGDTWEWNGTAWLQKSPALSPAPRRRPAMTFDSHRGVCVLYGGYSGSFNYPETWEWDGTQWTLRAVAHNPGARDSHEMAFDAARGRVVLFGGSVGTTVNDTWEYDGVDWTQIFPATLPPSVGGHRMAYDAARAKVVLFGGMDAGLNYYNDTWAWNGVDWKLMTPATKPPARHNCGMTYDAARERVVVYGGAQASALPFLADTWEYDGVNWIQRAPVTIPPAIAFQHLVYDSSRRMVVMFGGGTTSMLLPDTTEYYAIDPALTQNFGSPCMSADGSEGPRIGTTLPWLGYQFQVTVRSLFPTDAAFLLIGNSKSAWASYPLPLDLSFIGMDTCMLYTNPLVEVPLANNGGAATFDILLAPLPEWIGFSLYFQSLAVRPGSNVLGILTSDAAEAKFGVK